MRYGYARVSTRGQARDGNGLEVQVKALREAGAERIYSDAFSGTQKHRPQFDELLKVLQPGDILITVKLDRIARSAADGMEIIDSLLERGVSVDILNLGRLDGSPSGKLIRNVMLAFAEFERDLIVERTQAGKAIAKQNPSFREGRPLKYGKAKRDHALGLLETHSYSQVAEMTGISKSTLVRLKRKAGIDL